MDRETYLKVVALVGKGLDVDRMKQLRILLQPDEVDPIAEDRAIRGAQERRRRVSMMMDPAKRAAFDEMFPNARRLR